MTRAHQVAVVAAALVATAGEIAVSSAGRGHAPVAPMTSLTGIFAIRGLSRRRSRSDDNCLLQRPEFRSPPRRLEARPR
jgi:hypothetical protein